MTPSHKIRFAVRAADSRESSVFSVWVSGDDVYVAARSIAGHLRASLHKSGRWRIAFTAAQARAEGSLVPPGRDRAIVRWAKPSEFLPGLVKAFQVVVPESELSGVGTVPSPSTAISYHPAPD